MPTVLFYVQHLLGTGHLRRINIIARTLAQRGVQAVVISGGPPVAGLDSGDAVIEQLPPIRSKDTAFSALATETGAPVDEDYRSRRKHAILKNYSHYQPSVLVIEAFPFGRRQLRFEIIPLLEAALAAKPKPTIVSSVRDILQRKSNPLRIAEQLDYLNLFFDMVMVHGDPRFLALEASLPEAEHFKSKIHYTGFVMEPSQSDPLETKTRNKEVLVAAGGGAASGGLFEVAIEASHIHSTVDMDWHLLVGSGVSEADFNRLKSASHDHLLVERTRSDYRQLLSHCAVSVSQAGYNTVMDLLTTRAPAVLVPFSGSGETEQTQRSQRMAELGLAEVVTEKQLSAQSLAVAAAKAIKGNRRADVEFDFAGAAKSTELIKHWLKH